MSKPKHFKGSSEASHAIERAQAAISRGNYRAASAFWTDAAEAFRRAKRHAIECGRYGVAGGFQFSASNADMRAIETLRRWLRYATPEQRAVHYAENCTVGMNHCKD